MRIFCAHFKVYNFSIECDVKCLLLPSWYLSIKGFSTMRDTMSLWELVLPCLLHDFICSPLLPLFTDFFHIFYVFANAIRDFVVKIFNIIKLPYWTDAFTVFIVYLFKIKLISNTLRVNVVVLPTFGWIRKVYVYFWDT